MAQPMRSTDFRVIVEPILAEEFDGVYDQRADEWKQIFKERKGGDRSYKEEPMLFGFGAAPELPDGQAITYRSGGVLFIARYVFKVFGLAFALTATLVEDGEHISLGTIYAAHLAQSLIETKETRTANVINRAFNGSYTGGDGASLVSTSHPTAAGNISNQLTTAAVMSQTSVEQLCIQLRNAVDNNGKRIRLTPKKLVCSPSNVFQAEVILKSVLRTGQANNDINPIKSMGLFDGGQANLSRMTSTTAWGIQTGVERGLTLMMRRKLKKSMEGDFDTDSMRYKATERYIEGWSDWRDFWATPGV